MKHGGNIYKIQEKIEDNKADILDFSANISPFGIPEGVKAAMIRAIDESVHYPDPDCTRLRQAISQKEGVAADDILCGNGAADLLFRLILALKPKKVLLPVPAFIEYEEALRTVNAEVIYYNMTNSLTIEQDILQKITKDIDLIIICSPNNPTGISVDCGLLCGIVDKIKECGIKLLIDACFCEFKENNIHKKLSLPTIYVDNLIILKSFTKLYAIPGIRLGYCIVRDRKLRKRIEAAGQTWSVSHIAQEAGIAALRETEYVKAVIENNKRESFYLKKRLAELGCVVYPGEANFLLFQAKGDTTLDQRMLKHAIMIRNCSNYKNLGDDYYRIAIRKREQNIRLIEALEGEIKR